MTRLQSTGTCCNAQHRHLNPAVKPWMFAATSIGAAVEKTTLSGGLGVHWVLRHALKNCSFVAILTNRERRCV